MNRVARAQTAAGLTTVAALPLLYLGGIKEIAVLTGAGFVIFALGMLAVPLIRYLPTPGPPTDAPRAPAQTSPRHLGQPGAAPTGDERAS